MANERPKNCSHQRVAELSKRGGGCQTCKRPLLPTWPALCPLPTLSSPHSPSQPLPKSQHHCHHWWGYHHAGHTWASSHLQVQLHRQLGQEFRFGFSWQHCTKSLIAPHTYFGEHRFFSLQMLHPNSTNRLCRAVDFGKNTCTTVVCCLRYCITPTPHPSRC